MDTLFEFVFHVVADFCSERDQLLGSVFGGHCFDGFFDRGEKDSLFIVLANFFKQQVSVLRVRTEVDRDTRLNRLQVSTGGARVHLHFLFADLDLVDVFNEWNAEMKAGR